MSTRFFVFLHVPFPGVVSVCRKATKIAGLIGMDFSMSNQLLENPSFKITIGTTVRKLKMNLRVPGKGRLFRKRFVANTTNMLDLRYWWCNGRTTVYASTVSNPCALDSTIKTS